MKEILLITPPFTQLNTPYPATVYLKGFLNTKSIDSFQMDLGIEVIVELFSSRGLQDLFQFSLEHGNITSSNSNAINNLKDDYINAIDDVITFLQSKNDALANNILVDGYLPKASRFETFDKNDWAFEMLDTKDKAKHLATLYLEDLSDFIIECVDENFGFSRYAERLGKSANSFDELHEYLQNKPSYIDKISLRILDEKLKTLAPKLVCFSVPFPGNLYSSFRCAKHIKKHYPDIKIAMGGGFPNTELRSISDKRVFGFFDYITLDDGELPLELLVLNTINYEDVEIEKNKFKRTFLLHNGEIKYDNSSLKRDYNQSEIGCPDYSDLPLDNYISVIEVINPMHRLWSDGRWNKLTLAHGCYWGKCTFCDISLDYIKIYEPISARSIVDKIEKIIAQTGENGFHFVDEAAPPSLMRSVAIEIIKRDLTIRWWTNIRFEKSFTKDLCRLLKRSGCIAVSGGLEVASDRLLSLIDKGVTVEQVSVVTKNFSDCGIMVHAYLMYAFPSQTEEETIDSLEMVRQLFELELIQSGFWHHFALTAHSPIGLNPSEYGISPVLKNISFANNDIDFKDETGIDHDKFSEGLKKSLYNYMHGNAFELPLQDWFEFNVPKTSVAPNIIRTYIETKELSIDKPSALIVWLGGNPDVSIQSKTKKGSRKEILTLAFDDKSKKFEVKMDKEIGEWFLPYLEKLNVKEGKQITLSRLKEEFENNFDNFDLFWYSKAMSKLKEHGLLVL